MLRPLSLLALLATTSSFAASVSYVYPVAQVVTLKESTTAITTARGLMVFIDCNRNTFDDPTHDWVSGFASAEQCKAFVERAKKNIGHSEIELSSNELTLRVTH